MTIKYAFLFLLSFSASLVEATTSVIWRNQQSGQNWLHQFSAEQHLQGRELSTVADPLWQVVGSGDFDGDGVSDLLWRHAGTGLNWLYLTDGTKVTTSSRLNQVADLNWSVAGVGDFDGDGSDDILWRHLQTGQNWLYFMADGQIRESAGLNLVADQQWIVAGVGDLNADGRDDIVWRHQQTGSVWVYGMHGANMTHSAQLSRVADQQWQIAAVADFNGDHSDDLLWRHQVTGATYLYQTSAYQVAVSGPIKTVPTSWHIASVTDFNNDQQADILWRHDDGQLWLYLMDGATIEASRRIAMTIPVAWQPVASLTSESLSAWSIPLNVTEFSGVGRSSEMVRNGIPIDRALDIRDANTVQLVDEQGRVIPAQFDVLSRWAGGKDSTQPIQWLLVSFAADVEALATRRYILVPKASQTSSLQPQLIVAETDSLVQINTGVATFDISKTQFSVLERAATANQQTDIANATLSAGGGYSQISVNYADNAGPTLMNALPPDEVIIERQGPNTATIKVAGRYDNPPLYGGINLRYVARYTFFADSDEFELDFYFAWPGSNSGDKTNGTSISVGWSIDESRSKSLLIERASLVLPLTLSGRFDALVQAEQAITDSVLDGSNGIVSLTQLRRDGMADPSAYTYQLLDTMGSGGSAEHPFVAASGDFGGIGVSLKQMALYEPQSMSITQDALQLNVVNEGQWLSPFMGAFATMRFRLLDSPANETEAMQTVSALQSPLIAWPDVAYVAKTRCFEELWDGTESPLVDSFIGRVRGISDATFSDTKLLGMHGMMTYGVTPRYFEGSANGSYNEFGGDISATQWDGYYHGGTFTDYHNTFTMPTRLFAMTGEAPYLHNLSFPAARRTLHTQIIQYQPGLESAYSGWAPAGYGGYRRDFNSSHSYFDNLYLYYYLTGDKAVIDALAPAGKTIRGWYTRLNGELLPPDQPTPVSFVSPVGRVGSQMAEILSFLGHVSDDAGYLDDYLNFHDRVVTRQMALLTSPQYPGKAFAFFSGDALNDANGSFKTSQFWMDVNYTIFYLWKVYNEYGDRPMGTQGIPISHIFEAYHNTLWDYVARVHFSGEGDGTASGKWANSATVNYSGDFHGGEITEVLSQMTGESFIWNDSKTGFASLSLRAAAMHNNDSEMYAAGESMYLYLLGSSDYSIVRSRLGKIAGLKYKTAFQSLSYLVNRK